MADKKDENLLTEGKAPEEMTAQELEKVITEAQKVVEKPEQKEEPKQEGKPKEEKKKEETPEKNWYDTFSPEVQQLAKERGWKTSEEMFKSYRDAEKGLSQKGEEISKLRKKTEEYQQQLSQVYNFDEQGNLVGLKQRPTPQIQAQTDQLAGLRGYFPEYTDEQILNLIALNGIMIKSALSQFKQEYDQELSPLHEIRFERVVENQKKVIREKYNDFADFESEVNEKLNKLPASLRSKEGSVETIFLTVRGEHVPELLEKAKKGVLDETQKIEKKKEDAFVEGGGKQSAPTPPIDFNSLSSKEMEAELRKRGVKVTA
jgi:hypothetical protein